jgi:hypothetical protein
VRHRGEEAAEALRPGPAEEAAGRHCPWPWLSRSLCPGLAAEVDGAAPTRGGRWPLPGRSPRSAASLWKAGGRSLHRGGGGGSRGGDPGRPRGSRLGGGTEAAAADLEAVGPAELRRIAGGGGRYRGSGGGWIGAGRREKFRKGEMRASGWRPLLDSAQTRGPRGGFLGEVSPAHMRSSISSFSCGQAERLFWGELGSAQLE